MGRALIPLLLLAGATTAIANESWNQWRGPGRDAHADWFGEVSQWPSEVATIWSVEVGLGHASPVTDGERVCLHTREDRAEVVSCLAIEDGSELWRQSYPVQFKPAMGGGRHGAGPKATPALEDGRLFTFGIISALSAFAAESGELLWERNFVAQSDKAWPRWGTALSPLPLDGDVVVVYGRGRGAIVRLDGATGEVVWKLDGDGAAYSSPLVARFDGQRQLVVATSRELLGLTVGGEILWRTQHPSTLMGQGIATPVALGDLLVVSTGKRPLRALRPLATEAGWHLEELWQRPDITMETSSAVGFGDRICGLSRKRKGHAFCILAETGATLWQGPPRFAEHASIVVVPGVLLYQLSDGELVAVSSEVDEYSELARLRTAEGEVWAHPAPLAEGRLLIKSHSRLSLVALP